MESSFAIIFVLCVGFALLQTTSAARCYVGSTPMGQSHPNNTTECEGIACLVTSKSSAFHLFHRCGKSLTELEGKCWSVKNGNDYFIACCCVGDLCTGDDKVVEAAKKVFNKTVSSNKTIYPIHIDSSKPTKTPPTKCYVGQSAIDKLHPNETKMCEGTMCIKGAMNSSVETHYECGDYICSDRLANKCRYSKSMNTVGCCCVGDLCNGAANVAEAVVEGVRRNKASGYGYGDGYDWIRWDWNIAAIDDMVPTTKAT